MCVKIPLFYGMMVTIYGRVYVIGFVVAIITFLIKQKVGKLMLISTILLKMLSYVTPNA